VKNKWLMEKIVLVEKCIKQLVRIAERKQKFPSNPTHQDLCTAEIVTKNTKNQEEITTKVILLFGEIEKYYKKSIILKNIIFIYYFS